MCTILVSFGGMTSPSLPQGHSEEGWYQAPLGGLPAWERVNADSQAPAPAGSISCGAQHFMFYQALQRVREALSEIPTPGKERSLFQHFWQMLHKTFTGHMHITA